MNELMSILGFPIKRNDGQIHGRIVIDVDEDKASGNVRTINVYMINKDTHDDDLPSLRLLNLITQKALEAENEINNKEEKK